MNRCDIAVRGGNSLIRFLFLIVLIVGRADTIHFFECIVKAYPVGEATKFSEGINSQSQALFTFEQGAGILAAVFVDKIGKALF